VSDPAPAIPGQLDVDAALALVNGSTPPAPRGRDAVTGEVVDAGGLLGSALEVAARQRSPQTRRAYAGAYRAFCAGLGPGAGVEQLTAAAVRAYRDRLERAGRAPATVAVHLAALRRLAVELGADAKIADVRGERVPAGEPRALTLSELERLLAMPDLRATRGRRDYAALRLLADAGLRRSELCALTFEDIEVQLRFRDPRLRQAIRGSTAWAVRVRRAKRGRSRTVPLTADALDALLAWRRAPRLPGRHAVRLAAAHRAAPGAAVPARRGAARRTLRTRGRAARGPPLAARAPPHLLHPLGRRRCSGAGDPRACRARRHAHHLAVYRRRPRPAVGRDRPHGRRSAAPRRRRVAQHRAARRGRKRARPDVSSYAAAGSIGRQRIGHSPWWAACSR
jgi:integrase